MTVVTAPRATTTPLLDRVASLSLLGLVAALQLSIAAAGIMLGVTLLGWVLLLVRDRALPSAPRFFLPLVAYAGMTFVSVLFSLNAGISFVDSKQLVLFLIVPAVYHLARGERARLVVDVAITVGAASALYGIIQYGVLHYDNLGQRPDGALTHYMTYSGVLMLVVCAAVARLVFGSRDRTWPALVMPALVVALTLTLGRSAWVGTAVAVALLFALKDFRLTALLPVMVALLFAFGPDVVTTRLMSVFDQQDASRLDRVAMARAGVEIVRDFPLTGVGPDMMSRVYHEYRGPDAVMQNAPHLHNVPLQIAAERGLPALGIWIWFIAVLSTGLFRLLRGSADRTLPATGLAVVAAMLAAGLFEYNFGDSEFLMLFLILVTLPFAAARPSAGTAPAARWGD